MIALFDFIPRFCPNCGKPLGVANAPTSEDRKYHTHPAQDFNAFASHHCASTHCDLQFQKCETALLVDAADKTGGDLKQYA